MQLVVVTQWVRALVLRFTINCRVLLPELLG